MSLLATRLMSATTAEPVAEAGGQLVAEPVTEAGATPGLLTGRGRSWQGPAVSSFEPIAIIARLTLRRGFPSDACCGSWSA